MRRPRWRESGLAREALLTTPAVWDGADLVAAPLLDDGPFAARRTPKAPWTR